MTMLLPLVKRQSITGLTGLLLLLSRYITACQRCPGTTLSEGLSMATIGTVGPAVTGTVPTGLPRTRCSAALVGTLCALGSKALSSGPVSGLPSWPTVSGVQTWPVLGSRNSGTPLEAAASTLLRCACAKAADVIVTTTRQVRIFWMER